MSGVLFREHAEVIRNFFLGEPSKKELADFHGITIQSMTFPSASDCQIEDKDVLQHYFQAVQCQRVDLSKHSTLTVPPEQCITLVGASAVLMKCNLIIRGR